MNLRNHLLYLLFSLLISSLWISSTLANWALRETERIKLRFHHDFAITYTNALKKWDDRVLDTLVFVQLQVRINNSLVLDDFNTNKLLSICCFECSSDTKTTPNLRKHKTRSYNLIPVLERNLVSICDQDTRTIPTNQAINNL